MNWIDEAWRRYIWNLEAQVFQGLEASEMVETLSKFTLGLEYTKSSSNTAEDEVLHQLQYSKLSGPPYLVEDVGAFVHQPCREAET